MNVRKLPNGNLIVLRRAEGPGGIIGDGAEEIGPDHPDYQDYLAWYERFWEGASKNAGKGALAAKPKRGKRKRRK
jgi:hypothetical protein